jgi:hypothetical protein
VFDFAITQKGDLIFIQSQIKKQPIKLSFLISNSTAKKLSFNIIDSDPTVSLSNGLKISFVIDELPYNKRAMILQDDSAKGQALKIRIATALGQLKYRSTIGSLLESIRHKPIYDKTTITDAQKIVLDAISDLVTNPTVIVEPFIDKNLGYTQGLKINIYQDEFLIFNQSVEG